MEEMPADEPDERLQVREGAQTDGALPCVPISAHLAAGCLRLRLAALSAPGLTSLCQPLLSGKHAIEDGGAVVVWQGLVACRSGQASRCWCHLDFMISFRSAPEALAQSKVFGLNFRRSIGIWVERQWCRGRRRHPREGACELQQLLQVRESWHLQLRDMRSIVRDPPANTYKGVG